jgi:replicative DNA helicase
MSLVDLPVTQGGPPQDLGRTPPQDVAAEQSVLGGMMLSKDAIADVIEVLRSNDFYRPAHELIYDSILDLYGRGEPADAVTVADELTKRGDLSRIGGPAYLHTLISSVPTAANAGFYARIVRERAVLRRLVEAGTRIVQLGYGGSDGRGGGDVDEIVNSAQAEVYAVTETRTSEDYAPLGDVIEGTIDEIEASSHRGDGLTGVPTGFVDLDRLTNGLHAGQMIVIAARPAMGKALALETPLATPTGWTTMADVEVGDELIGADGRPTRVVAATDVMIGRPCYEVVFSDGSTIIADAQHQWLTETRASRRSAQEARKGCRSQQAFAAVRTTEELATTLRCETADRRLNHSVTNAQALQLPERELLVPPYVLGAWLGDGTSATAQITTADPGIVMRLEAEGLIEVPSQSAPLRFSLQLPRVVVESRTCVVCDKEFQPKAPIVRTCGRSCGGRAPGVSEPVLSPACPDCGRSMTGFGRCQDCHSKFGTLTARLKTIGVLKAKHVPAAYLRASEAQRRDLLAGLLDTDGTVAATGAVQFSVTNERLALDVQELVISLGYRCSIMRKRVPGRTEASSVAYALNFTTDDDVFHLERKRLLHKERRVRRFQRRDSRFITEVRPIESVPVRCVQVANDSHLFLAGRTMIPTHNSTLGLDIARSAAIHHQMAAVMFSLEMGRNEITMRLLSAEARIPLQNMRKGTMREEDWTRLAKTMGEVSEAPFFIDDSPNMSLMEIRAKCRRLKQKHDLKLVVIDYLQLMTSGKRVESRQQEVSEFSRALKLLAKEIQVPVIALSQLNRGAEQRTDKKPQMSDLRESGCLTADTRVLRADTGTEVTLEQLYTSGAKDVPVWSLDHSLRYVRRHLTHVFSTGRKPVFRVRLASGKEIRTTANHPFLSYEGWVPIGDLTPGSRVATPRHVMAPEARMTAWDDRQVVLLATRFGLAEGSLTAVPGEVFSLPKRQIALFLRHFWAAGGSVALDSAGARVKFPSTSRVLLHDVSRLFLRFGISCRITEVPRSGDRVGSLLEIPEVEDQRRFLNEISTLERPTDTAVKVPNIVSPALASGTTVAGSDEIWDRVRGVIVEHTDQGEPVLSVAGRSDGRSAAPHPRRQRLGKVAELLSTADLEMHAVNDVLWDTVVAIEPDGEAEVFDATVVGNHNFIANGIAVHNSIEQDADIVILLHREDAYEKESPRAGEADFIIAKHRNGPTDTITVAFQGHYSRFVDMAT